MTSTPGPLSRNRDGARPSFLRWRVPLTNKILQIPLLARIFPTGTIKRDLEVDELSISCIPEVKGAHANPTHSAAVGAGTLVVCHVPDYALAIGNPAKVTLDRRAKNLSYDPVIFAAPYEAWIGRNASLKTGLSTGGASP